MARISLDPPDTRLNRLGQWYARRTYGDVPQPGLAMMHNQHVLRSTLGFERSLARWKRVPRSLKELATLASATTIGCSWCIDFGTWLAYEHGVSERKLRDVPRWRDSDAFTDLERLVLEYAESMSATPPAVTDDVVAELRQHLDDGQLVELTMMIAVENERSRFNAALGLTSQGFTDRCEFGIERSARGGLQTKLDLVADRDAGSR
jgi:AhpD family alkylhydroperoxidase